MVSKDTQSYEIFFQNNTITSQDWYQLEEKIAEYDKKFSIEIVLSANRVEFFLSTTKDLFHIMTRLGGIFLKPFKADSQPQVSKSTYYTSHFTIPQDKDIFEVIEKEKVKKHIFLKSIKVTRHRLLFFLRFYAVDIVLEDSKDKKYLSTYMSLHNPLYCFEFDFQKNVKLQKKSIPTFLKIDDAIKLFTSSSSNSFLEVSGFPYFSQQTYFPLSNFDFGKHSLIVGQTGVGKSKFIELFIKQISRLHNSDEYRIILIDPHAALYPNLLSLVSTVNFDFLHASCNLFPSSSEPKISTELTILLFKTLLKDQFNAKMERVLKYVTYILFLKNAMTLPNLKLFLTDLRFRKTLLEGLGDEYDYLKHFFETEYVEMQTKFYEVAIMPVLVLIDELSFIPAFAKDSPHHLENVLQEKFLTTFSLNRIFLGDKATRLIAGLIIQQVFLIAQKQAIRKKIILIIDEVSVVENESLVSILSEARKFDLSLFLSQQYLTQISPELLKSVLSNIYNYFVFKVSDEDAKILTKNLDIKFPDELLVSAKAKGMTEDDMKRNILVTLNPRESLVRVFAAGAFQSCFKAHTLSI